MSETFESVRAVLVVAFFFSCLLGPFIALVRGGAGMGVLTSLGVLALWIGMECLQAKQGLWLVGSTMEHCTITTSSVVALIVSLVCKIQTWE
jgi:hypothetical protein